MPTSAAAATLPRRRVRVLRFQRNDGCSSGPSQEKRRWRWWHPPRPRAPPGSAGRTRAPAAPTCDPTAPSPATWSRPSTPEAGAPSAPPLRPPPPPRPRPSFSLAVNIPPSFAAKPGSSPVVPRSSQRLAVPATPPSPRRRTLPSPPESAASHPVPVPVETPPRRRPRSPTHMPDRGVPERAKRDSQKLPVFILRGRNGYRQLFVCRRVWWREWVGTTRAGRGRWGKRTKSLLCSLGVVRRGGRGVARTPATLPAKRPREKKKQK
jgi:hypothetical protein